MNRMDQGDQSAPWFWEVVLDPNPSLVLDLRYFRGPQASYDHLGDRMLCNIMGQFSNHPTEKTQVFKS